MASAPKLARMQAAAIEPDLKAFLDEVLVPMLVRDALRELAAENTLASVKPAVAHSRSTSLRGRSASEETV